MTLAESFQGLYDSIYSLTGVNPIIFLGAFALVFGVVYAVTSNMELFKTRKGLCIGISFAFALIVATSPMIGNLFAKALPGVGIFMVFLMLVIFSIALLIPQSTTPNGKWVFVVVAIIIIVIGYIFFSSYQFPTDITKINLAGLSLTKEDITTIAIVAVFIGLIAFGLSIIKGGKKGGEG